MKVEDVMTRDVVAVQPETPLKRVAELLVEHGISGLPVVDPAGTVLGVVSETDFVIKEGGTEGVRHRLLGRLFGESRQARAEVAKIKAQTAGQAMTSPARTVRPDQTIHEAAQLMAGGRINRLPVVADGRLVGIVTRADVVRAYLRPDAELERLVRDEVLAKTAFWLEPESFRVTVRDGVVSIHGRVDRRSLADTIVEVIGGLGGVIGVDADLSWEVDDVAPAVERPEPDVLRTLRPH